MIRVLAIAALLLGAVPSAALANEGGGGLISLDKSIVIQAINFGLLLFILIKLLYKPLLAKMEERTEAIRSSLEEAQAARAEAERERAEHAAKLQASYAEAQAIRASRAEGGGGGAAPAAWRRPARRRRAWWRRPAASSRRTSAARARNCGRRWPTSPPRVAERLIRKSLRDEDHRRIIEDAIGRVDRVS